MVKYFVDLASRAGHLGCLIVFVVTYALSPIDLIPDPIPIFGYLDDLILLPLGIVLALRVIPPAVMTESRERSRQSKLAMPSAWKWVGVIVWIFINVDLPAALAEEMKR